MRTIDLSLYLVLDAQACGNQARLLTVAREALAAGITVLQLRSHHPDWTKRIWYEVANALKPLCANYHVPFIINDEVDIALAVGSDGVHIGQDDLPPSVVRKLIGEDAILGLSTHNINQVNAVDNHVVDYIGMGPVFTTFSKAKPDPTIGEESLRAMVEAKNLPAVAIGGINQNNVTAIRQINPEGIAVISAICQAENIAQAVDALR